MNHYNLADLDELALRCRDEQAREYIREAVACYKSGAFRSCIVATWIAVVYDIIHKLRELEHTGDNNAKKKLAELEAIRAGGDSKLKEALEFERDVIKVAAEEFELLSPLERQDIERLQSDRGRCAHPSMRSLEEPYIPTPELARAHLRNAVEILLQREPVQGKAASEWVFAQIKSNYFPDTVTDAKTHLESGPLKRAKSVLVRSMVVGLSKAYLIGSLPHDEMKRLLAALGAIVDMHRSSAEKTLQADIPTIMSRVADSDLWKIIAYVRAVPVAWEAAGDAIRGTVCTYLKQVPADQLLKPVSDALYVQELQDLAWKRVGELSYADWGRLFICIPPTSKYIEIAVDRLRCAGSFSTAEYIVKELLLPHADTFDVSQLEALLNAVMGSSQAYGSSDMPDILADLFEHTNHLLPQASDIWKRLNDYIDGGPYWPWARIDYTVLKDKMRKAGILPQPEEN